MEEMNTDYELFRLMYKKTGLYIVYPFLLLLVLIVAGLLWAERELTIEMHGVVSSRDDSRLIFSDISGRVSKIYVNNHQKITVGDTILTLDTGDIQEEIIEQERDRDELIQRLLYLETFKISVEEGENRFSTNTFGYRTRLTLHLAEIQRVRTDDTYATSVNEMTLGQISARVVERERRMQDYRSFNSLVRGEAYQPFVTSLVHAKVNEYLFQFSRLETDEERTAHRRGAIVQNEQHILALQEEINALNVEREALETENERGDTQQTLSQMRTTLISEIETLDEETRNQLRLVESELDLLRSDYTSHTILSSHDGLFYSVEPLSVGNTINSSERIGRVLTENEERYLRVYMPGEDRNRVLVNQKVRFATTDGNNEQQFMQGEIVAIHTEPVQTESGNFFITEVELEGNSTSDLHYGMIGEVLVITGHTNYFRYFWDMFFG